MEVNILFICAVAFSIGLIMGAVIVHVSQKGEIVSDIHKKGFFNINDHIKITGKIEVRE